MSKRRETQDHWFREAKRLGYRSRAAFKLLELDEKRGVLEGARRVLDCGCKPGSWLQVCLERLGPSARIVGIDRHPLRDPPEDERSTVLVGDLRETPAADLLAPVDGRRYDVVLSDMAPDTTGDRTIDHHGSINLCHAVLDRCPDVLRPGGTCVLKVLEGAAYPDLLARLRESFDEVRGYKPAASRAVSTEIFVVARGMRAGDAVAEADDDAADAPPVAPPPRRGGPSRGWGD